MADSLDVTRELGPAMEQGRLELYFQPQVDLATGAVVGMEALLRWVHETRGLLEPAAFLPAVRAAGLIVGLGRHVLERAAREAASWQQLPHGGEHTLWVNVAEEQLVQPRFGRELAALVEAAGLRPGSLGIEVPASAVITGGAAVRVGLDEASRAGVRVALDDYGLSTHPRVLRMVGLDAVKLDRALVEGVGTDPAHDGIVAAVVDSAHADGLLVVAECVESWSEGTRLLELGCDRAHGYLFAAPTRADRARWMLSSQTGWRGTHVGDPTEVVVPRQRDEAGHRGPLRVPVRPLAVA